MTESFTSRFGVSSKNFITSCTIRVVACLSWACFLERTSTWSLRRLQSPEFLLMVTMAIRRRDVVARSEAYRIAPSWLVLRWIGERSDDGTPYLSGLLLQHQQLVDGTLDIGLNRTESVYMM
jgi:hypothetical protein